MTDSTPDRSAAADTAEPKAKRSESKAKRSESKAKRSESKTADAVEPHWDLVIAAATD